VCGVEHGEEIQEGKAQCIGAHEEKDEEDDAEKETGAKAHARFSQSISLGGVRGREEGKETRAEASARSGRSIGLGGLRWQDRQSLGYICPSTCRECHGESQLVSNKC
jgi:hypothetical protein